MNERTRAQTGAAREGPLFSWVSACTTFRQTASSFARVRLAAPGLPTGRPGQFVLVRPAGTALLPRAFSVFDADPGEVELFVKADGVLRRQLFEGTIGERFEVRGPYGVPFSDVIDPGRRYMLVGGGCGIAPLRRFADVYPGRVAATVYGFRTAEVEGLLSGVHLVTEENGGEMAHERARAVWRPGMGVLACGPEPMLREVARAFRGAPDVYVSLECRIGCGIGACRGCSILTTRGMRRVCRDGPLFAAEEVPWLI